MVLYKHIMLFYRRRATRLAEFELETRRQEKIATLLRRLYIEEKMRRLTAKRSSLPVEPMHIDGSFLITV